MQQIKLYELKNHPENEEDCLGGVNDPAEQGQNLSFNQFV